MKLYTESEIRSILEDIGTLTTDVIDWYINEATPIELPSDEELEEWIVNRNYEFSRVDIQTTKWVIEQIKKQVIP